MNCCSHHRYNRYMESSVAAVPYARHPEIFFWFHLVGFVFLFFWQYKVWHGLENPVLLEAIVQANVKSFQICVILYIGFVVCVWWIERHGAFLPFVLRDFKISVFRCLWFFLNAFLGVFSSGISIKAGFSMHNTCAPSRPFVRPFDSLDLISGQLMVWISSRRLRTIQLFIVEMRSGPPDVPNCAQHAYRALVHGSPLTVASFLYGEKKKKKRLNQISVSIWSICRIFSFSEEFMIVNSEPNWTNW